MFCLRQITRGFSKKAQRGSFTWVVLDHYKLKQTPAKGLFRGLLEDVPNIHSLQKEIALQADRFGVHHMSQDISIFQGNKQLDALEVTPEATKENPLIAKMPLKEEEERAIAKAEQFANKLMATNFEDLEIPQGMENPPEKIYILRGIPKIDADYVSGTTDEYVVYDIYVRDCVRRFWATVGRTVQ